MVQDIGPDSDDDFFIGTLRGSFPTESSGPQVQDLLLLHLGRQRAGQLGFKRVYFTNSNWDLQELDGHRTLLKPFNLFLKAFEETAHEGEFGASEPSACTELRGLLKLSAGLLTRNTLTRLTRTKTNGKRERRMTRRCNVPWYFHVLRATPKL